MKHASTTFFLTVCRKANTSYGVAVLHARSALRCGEAATSRENAGAFSPFIIRWVESVEILAVELILNHSHSVAEALEMHDLAFAEEAERIGDVGII